MGAFHKKPEFKDVKDKAQMDMLQAQQSGDPTKIAAATENIGRIVAIEEISKTTNKTEAQIQSDLITEIQDKQAKGDKKGAALAQTLLRQRQILAKTPGAEGKTDADKISQANLIQVATRTRATTIEQSLPPGTFITSTDTQGNVTMTLRDLSQGDLFRRGDAIAANAIIKEMTKPDGSPRSEMHKNAMMSAGIRFDESGKAIKPAVPELPVKGGTPKPPPAAATPAAAAAPIPRGATTRPATTQPTTSAVPKWNPATNSWE